MGRMRLALAFALSALVLTPQAAAGGGWWSYIEVDRSTVAAGQRVEIAEAVAFRSIAAAEEAQETGQFYVYLLRDFDYSVVARAMGGRSPREWWSLGGAEAIQVGPVAVRVSDANLARARAAFTVPELSPGTYHLMLCDAGCAEPLADVIPAKGFNVVADPATAQMAQRVDHLERLIRNQARVLDAVRSDAVARDTRSAVEQLDSALSSVADEGRSSPWAYFGWLVAGLLVGALAFVVLRRRWLRPPRPAGWHPSDEEWLALLSDRNQPAGRARVNN